jgi:glycosyltransferase involved in cell wall biosynthesis
MNSSRSLDVIIPVYNEAMVLPQLFEQLDEVFSPPMLASSGSITVRFIFVDDGSSDETAALIADRIRNGWRAVLLCLSRNFGHQAAIAAGLDHTTADLVAVMDADLQDPPKLVLDMIHRLDEGFDIVYAQRRTRQEPFYKRVMYSGFYRLCSFLSEVYFPMDAGDFCVMSQEVVLVLRQLREKLRFNRGLRSWIGFRQSAFIYDRPARQAGDTKYTWSKLYALATDGIASLSTRPLRFTQGLLFISLLVTFTYVTLTTVFFLRSHALDSTALWFLSTQGLIAFTSSLQLFSLYILGAYIGRTYLEVKSRPSYIVMRVISPASSRSA